MGRLIVHLKDAKGNVLQSVDDANEPEITVTETDVDGIVEGLLTGACGYWATVRVDCPSIWASEWSPQQVLTKGGTILIRDDEGKDPVPPLTLGRLLLGIARYYSHGGEETVPIDDVDSSDVDQIVQYALFGKLVYG